jgi:hypothetical protein
MLRDPDGRDALLVTLFVPTEGAASGEAGSLLYLLLDGPRHVLTVRHQTPSLTGGSKPPAGHLPREGSIVP